MSVSVLSYPEAQPDCHWQPVVLVVDDSAAQRQLLVLYLKRLSYHVLEAGSAEDGLVLCQTKQVDIVISDWMMPGMSGIEFCKKFRSLPRHGYGYFILLTSNSDRAAVAKGLDAGADDFVTKPVSADELRGRLRPALRIITMQSELMQKNQEVASSLAEQKRLYSIIERDLIEARKLQLTLMPDHYRNFCQAGVAMMIRPSGHVGGDLIGCLRLDEDHIAAYSIDVSGHGVASAMMTARLAGYLSAGGDDRMISWAKAEDGTPRLRRPAEVAEAFNRLMLNDIRAEQYFTMVYAEITLSTGEIRLVQAGHPHPVILRKSGAQERVGAPGLPIGLIEDASYSDNFVKLEQGDRLFLMSDGFIECPGLFGQDLGEEGLEAMMARYAPLGSTNLLEALVEGLAAYSGSENFPDDVSGLVVEYYG